MSRTLFAVCIAGGVLAGLPVTASPVAATATAATMATAYKHPIKVDGLFRSETEWAVKDFQKRTGMKVDGVAGPATLKALGLTFTKTLRRNGGYHAEVKELQAALNKHAGTMAPKPAAKPAAKPKPKPTMKPSAKPTTMWTPAPTPMPTPEPTVMPTPEPWTPAPTVAPSEMPMDETYRHWLEISGGDWMLPLTPGGSDYDFGFKRPTYFAHLGLWAGDWGLGADTTFLPAGAMAAGSAQTNIYDGQLKWRGSQDWGNLALGWRGIGAPGAPIDDYLTLGAGLNIPLGTDVLKLHLGALGGYGLGSLGVGGAQATGWTADGNAALGLHLGPVGIKAGWRYLVVNRSTGQMTWQGPTVGAGLAF